MKTKRPQIVIQQLDNGYFIRGKYSDYAIEQVYQTKGGDGNTKVNDIVQMFWDIAEYLGELGNRHDKERIFIGIRQGDKHEANGKTGKV